MRTTVDLDPQLLKRLRAEAYRQGVPLKQLLTTVLHRGLADRPARARPRYRCPTFGMGAVTVGIDLDRALHLAQTMEDDEVARKLTLRK